MQSKRTTYKKCRNCDKSFQVRYSTTQVYCSPACAYEYKKKAPAKKRAQGIGKKKAKKAAKRRMSTAGWDKKMWTLFSKYIRLRDALRDSNGNLTLDSTGTPVAQCISCGVVKPIVGLMDAGHFVTRNAKAIKYNEKNVHAQCKDCNGFQEGNSYPYGLALDRMYGKGTAERLLAQRHSRAGYNTVEFALLYEDYSKKLREMENEAGWKWGKK